MPPLTEDELNLVVSEMESYLCEGIFQRKCRVPFIVQKGNSFHAITVGAYWISACWMCESA